MRPTAVLPSAILDLIGDRRSRALPRETGGFLLGLRRGDHIEVTAATTEGPLDEASPVHFTRADPGHAERAASAWEESGGLVSLVGDWHSHPHGHGDPSSVDVGAWRELLRATSGAPVIGLVHAGLSPRTVVRCRRGRTGIVMERLGLVERTPADHCFAGDEVRSGRRGWSLQRLLGGWGRQ